MRISAGRTQQQILEKLREMEEILRNRHETDSETLVKKLKQGEQALDELLRFALKIALSAPAREQRH